MTTEQDAKANPTIPTLGWDGAAYLSPIHIHEAKIQPRVSKAGKPYSIYKILASPVADSNVKFYVEAFRRDYDVIRAIQMMNPKADISITWDESRKKHIFGGFSP